MGATSVSDQQFETQLSNLAYSFLQDRAPALIDYEFVSALRGLTRGRHLSAGRAGDALTDFEVLPVHRWEAAAALRRRAFGLRENLTAYDAAYVALAEGLGCALVTRDERLARTRGHDVSIVVL